MASLIEANPPQWLDEHNGSPKLGPGYRLPLAINKLLYRRRALNFESSLTGFGIPYKQACSAHRCAQGNAPDQ